MVVVAGCRRQAGPRAKQGILQFAHPKPLQFPSGNRQARETQRRVMDPSLQCFLLLTATVAARDEDATRQVLRDAALQLEPRQAHKVVDLLQRSITGGGRAWLRRLA